VAENLWKYITGGVVGVLLLSLFIVLLGKYFKRRKDRNSGKLIEESIDKKLSEVILLKKVRGFVREEKYQHAIIYLFYAFRIFCKDKLAIRNAQIMEYQELAKTIAGTDNISIMDFEKFIAKYERAYIGEVNITRDEYMKFKELYNLFSKKDL